jgi:hypothetical protein
VRYLSVKNHERFQHYKHRNPPWIKLYTELLDDYEFGRLADASKLLAILLWLLAAKQDNRIPYDQQWIERRLPITAPIDLQPLIDQGFIYVVSDDASNVLAERLQDASGLQAVCKQDAMSETETETETEKREDQKLLSTSRETRRSVALAKVSSNGKHPSRSARHPLTKGVADVVVRQRIAEHFAHVEQLTSSKRALRSAQVDVAFSYWVAKHGKDSMRTLLDRKRELLITRRLDESNGDLSAILYAIDGSLKDRALVEGGYNAIETILRDRGNVERLAEQMPKYRAGELHPMAKRLIAMTNGAEVPDGPVG